MLGGQVISINRDGADDACLHWTTVSNEGCAENVILLEILLALRECRMQRDESWRLLLSILRLMYCFHFTDFSSCSMSRLAPSLDDTKSAYTSFPPMNVAAIRWTAFFFKLVLIHASKSLFQYIPSVCTALLFVDVLDM